MASDTTINILKVKIGLLGSRSCERSRHWQWPTVRMMKECKRTLSRKRVRQPVGRVTETQAEDLTSGGNVCLGEFDELRRATSRESEEPDDRFKATHTCPANPAPARFRPGSGDSPAFLAF